jgi:hypothetical protein
VRVRVRLVEDHRMIAQGLQTATAPPRCYIRDPFGLVFNIGQAGAV